MAKLPLSQAELAQLNDQFETAHPTEIIRWAVETFRPDVALTSSFGADSAALIHMALQVDPALSIRTVDTGFLFPETLQFMEELRRRWHLQLSVFRTSLSEEEIARLKREHATRPIDERYCCGEYKRAATERALQGLRCWMTGLMRSEAATRRDTPIVEVLTNDREIRKRFSTRNCFLQSACRLRTRHETGTRFRNVLQCNAPGTLITARQLHRVCRHGKCRVDSERVVNRDEYQTLAHLRNAIERGVQKCVRRSITQRL